MPSTYSTSLRLELQADGENAGTWGQKTNTNLGTLLEQSIAGWATIAVSGATVLTALNGLSDQARNAVLNLTNGGVAAPFTVTVPAHSKVYVFDNQSGQTATITGGGTTFAIPTGKRRAVYVDTSGNVAEYVNDVSTLAALAGATFTGGLSATTLGLSGTLTLTNAATNEAEASISLTGGAGQSPAIGGAAANTVVLTTTGGGTITGFDTVQAGVQRIVLFGVSTTLIHGANLNLPGLANIVTANSDRAIFESRGAGAWYCIAYIPFGGQTVFGVATKADMQAGTNATKIVTPLQLLQHPSTVKAYGIVTSSGSLVVGSYPAGATSVANSVGNYTITHGQTFASTNYIVLVAGESSAGVGVETRVISRTQTTVTVERSDSTGAVADGNMTYATFGTLA